MRPTDAEPDPERFTDYEIDLLTELFSTDDFRDCTFDNFRAVFNDLNDRFINEKEFLDWYEKRLLEKLFGTEISRNKDEIKTFWSGALIDRQYTRIRRAYMIAQSKAKNREFITCMTDVLKRGDIIILKQDLDDLFADKQGYYCFGVADSQKLEKALREDHPYGTIGQIIYDRFVREMELDYWFKADEFEKFLLEKCPEFFEETDGVMQPKTFYKNHCERRKCRSEFDQMANQG